MAINVTPIPGLDPDINALRRKTADFINDEILPNEEVLWRSRRAAARTGEERDADRQESRELREEVKAKVNRAGLWAPHLPKEYGGMGLDFLALAYMYEILAYAVGAATLFGIAAPNSGNSTILVKYGTEEQKRKWLLPLIEGTMQSGFSMTEPDHAGSDPRSIETEAVRDGDDWVINGHKWFTSNGIEADFFIVMCRANDPTGELGAPGRMTQIIVPTDTPGVNIVRGIGIFGHATSDHCEIKYENVRVPVENTQILTPEHRHEPRELRFEAIDGIGLPDAGHLEVQREGARGHAESDATGVTRLAHTGLMNSPGHRANILRPQFGRVGISIVEGGFRGLMVAQEFRD